MSICDEITEVVAQRLAGDKQRERLLMQQLAKQFKAEDIRALGIVFIQDDRGYCARLAYQSVSFLVRIGEWQWTQPEGVPHTWTVEKTITHANGRIERAVDEGIALSHLRQYIRDTAVDAVMRTRRV